MSGIDDRERQFLARVSECYVTAYLESGNALFAWEVFRLYRMVNEPPPSWVMEYLDRVGKNLRAARERPQANPAAAIAEALEMKAPGKSGRGSVFSDDLNGRLDLAHDVMKLVVGRVKETAAIAEVAKARGVSQSKVRSAYRSFDKALTLRKSPTFQN